MNLQMSNQRYERPAQQQQHPQPQHPRRPTGSPDRSPAVEFLREHYALPHERHCQGAMIRDAISSEEGSLAIPGEPCTCDPAWEGAGLRQPLSPPPSPPPSTVAPTPPPRSARAGHRLSLSIPRMLRQEKLPWVSLEGLASCALACLGKEECCGISELGRGSHNSLYELHFSDGATCAASVSNSPEEFFSVDAKRSEIATMQYLYSSPLYNIPIPRVYAWDYTFNNPVGAPYVLRECVHGKNMSEDGRFYRLSLQDRMKVVKELAYVQAELSKPSEFDKLGCIYRKETGAKEFYVGKMVTIPSGCTKEDQDRQQYLGPYSTLPELWEKRIEREFHFSSQNWKSLNSSEDLSSHLAKNIDPDKANPVEFGEIMQLLSGLVTLFSPPEEFSTLCIQHSDLAIRNVLFDENTLKITGVIDWEFASVMPIVITGRFPNDLGWEGNQFAKSLGKLGPFLEGEVWNHHYYDWTSLKGVTPPACSDPPSPPASPDYILQREDYLTSQNATANGCLPQTPESEFFCEEGALSPPSPPLPPPPTSETSQQDLTSRASNLVELQYLRKFYASKVASRDFELTRLFIDSVAYIKFNEIVMGGAEKWFISADWIKEVFWRLRAEDRTTRAKLARGGGVVVLPEVFHQQCSRRQEVDLGEWEVQPKRLRQHIG